MSSLAGMNKDSLGEMLGREVTDVVVLVAKNVILGGNEETVAQVLGCDVDEVRELMKSEDYHDVHMLMAAQYNHDNIEADLSYDGIEQLALGKILKGLEREKDLDKLVRIATMANRATRRQKVNHSDALDPGRAGGRIQLTLTKRLVEKLQNGGIAREETKQISISGGATTPSFEEIDGMFNPKARREVDQRLVNQGEELTAEVIGRLLGGES